jgi:murein DD-endopeptidase MepM/ murein hydrolase activator NlpD
MPARAPRDAGGDVTSAEAGAAASTAADGGARAAVTTCGGWKVADVVVRGSIAGALVGALDQDASEVAAHYARLFMWDLDLRRDVVPGDRMMLAWRAGDGAVEIGAARYVSQRLGRSLHAYRFQAPDDQHPSYWDAGGGEVPRRLKGGPLRAYDQITALLKDRPTHKGMDFKTATGTEVFAPRAGVVSRIDWKRKGNGRCLELRFADGVTAKFLHLSAVKVARGARVKPGQLVALTGNSGHSTAPHLHYQLGRGQRILDPVDYHGATRRRLGGEALLALQAQIAALRRSCGDAAP